MPEITPNPCVVCGEPQSPPLQMGTSSNSWQCFCYSKSSDHATMVSGRTASAAVERWNRLNPLPGEHFASATPEGSMHGLRGLLRRLYARAYAAGGSRG